MIGRVVVAGAGLAGIACAVRLAEGGVRVTLVESRRRLGGRAWSFADPSTGEPLDNAQHVVLGCCTSYVDLLTRLGADGELAWTDELRWLEAGGRESIIRPSVLPPPAHLAPSLARARFLDAREKVGVACAMAMIACGRVPASAGTFADVLGALDQPPGAVERLWRPLIVSACNLEPSRVDARVALKVIRDGLLLSRAAGRVGVPRVTLGALYARAEEILARAGGGFVLGAAAARLTPTRCDLADGRELRADAVVCALPAEKAVGVVRAGDDRPDPRLAALAALEHSPIVGVHVWLDRPVMGAPHAALVGRDTQWIFRAGDGASDGERLRAVISAADEWVDRGEEAIVERVVEDLRACLPAGRGARVLRSLCVKERRATFAATPAFERARRRLSALPMDGHRPLAGPGEAVVLAGDYTDTGWPATMEGAVRSGYAAAGAVLGCERGDLLAPDLRPWWRLGANRRGTGD